MFYLCQEKLQYILISYLCLNIIDMHEIVMLYRFAEGASRCLPSKHPQSKAFTSTCVSGGICSSDFPHDGVIHHSLFLAEHIHREQRSEPKRNSNLEVSSSVRAPSMIEFNSFLLSNTEGLRLLTMISDASGEPVSLQLL